MEMVTLSAVQLVKVDLLFETAQKPPVYSRDPLLLMETFSVEQDVKRAKGSEKLFQ